MKLKEFRRKAGLTQQEIANKLNMSKTGYNSWESGRTQPNLEILVKLANMFHTTVDALLGHDVPYLLDKSTLTEKQKAILDLLPEMNDRVCERAEAYIYGLIEGEKEHEITVQKFRK